MEAQLNGPSGQVSLGPGVTTLGRAPDNQVIVNDSQSSSHHAEIRQDGQGYMIIDKGSTNGTFVNEQRLASQAPRMLIPGDRIRIGGTTFTYEASGASAIEPTVFAGSTPPGSPGNVPAPPPFANYGGSPPPYSQQQSYPQPPAYSQPPAYPQSQPDYPQRQPQYPVQPGAPGQGVPPVPGSLPNYGQPPRKKSRAGCWVVLIIVILLIGGAVAFAFSPFSPPALKGLLGGSTPDKTALAYCNALKNKDYPTAYDQLSTRGKSQVSEQEFASVIPPALASVGGVANCAASNEQINGSKATAVLTITTGNGQTKSETDNYVLENGVWKFDGTVQP